MNLKTKYNAILNKKERINIKKSMISLFGLSETTVTAWLCGIKEPNSRYHSAIAEIMGTDVSELFPNTNNNSELTTNTQAK